MIWIEVLSRSHVVLARHRCTGPEIRIGRGYDNDVVVDDPYVDARHMRIVRGAGNVLVAEDLGSVNGLYTDRSSRRVERLVLDGNGLVGIGRTYLRIREAGHDVAPARVARSHAPSVPVLVALGAATLGAEVLSLWLGETSEPRLSDYLGPLLVLCGVVLAWTGGWAILARVFSGHANVERTLSIALGGALLFVLGPELAGIAAFALSWSALATYSYAGAWALLAALCLLQLREIRASRLRLKGGALAALAVVAVAVQTLMQFEVQSDSSQRFSVEQSDERRHVPPAFRLVPLQSDAAFFAGAAKLKAKLDKDRTK
jgi:hypothetical protein